MIELLSSIISNEMVFKVGTWYCIPITIAVIVLFFVKTSRDERGRAIIGKASIISTIAFIVLINIYAKLSDELIVDYLTMACSIIRNFLHFQEMEITHFFWNHWQLPMN